jgi:hypothetical protein
MGREVYIIIKEDLSDCYGCTDCTLAAEYIGVSTMTIKRHVLEGNYRIKGYRIFIRRIDKSRRGKK